MSDKQKFDVQTRFDGTVALWFTSHYPLIDRDWKNIKEFGGAYHPLAGYYKSDDPGVLRQQLQWMRRAGIDLIVYDCFSTSSKSTTLKELPQDKTLQLLLSELSNQQKESRKLQLCVWLEQYAANPSVEHYRYALDYVKEHMAEQPYYYRYNNRPLVVTYLNNENRAIEDIEFENTYFELRRIRPSYTDVWSYIEPYPQSLRRDWMSVCPGFDSYLEGAYTAKYLQHSNDSPDFDAIRKNSWRADPENGAYYQRQILRAKQADPDIIFVSGWNDWQYGNHIEPAEEYEFLYVDLTAKILGRWKETESYR